MMRNRLINVSGVKSLSKTEQQHLENQISYQLIDKITLQMYFLSAGN